MCIRDRYGISLNIMECRWLQVCVRVPSQWKGDIAPVSYTHLVEEIIAEGDFEVDLTFGPSIAVSYTHLDVYKRQAQAGKAVDHGFHPVVACSLLHGGQHASPLGVALHVDKINEQNAAQVSQANRCA